MRCVWSTACKCVLKLNGTVRFMDCCSRFDVTLQGQILDSKEYYAPIITPFEAQLAFTAGAEWSTDYRLDFGSLLLDDPASAPAAGVPEPRFSLLDGSYHGAADDNSGSADLQASGAIVPKASLDVAAVDPSKRHLVQV